MPETPRKPSSTGEVVQIPRQRVEASFRQQQETANELILVLNKFTGSLGDSTKRERLSRQLENQKKEFKERIINNLPEAQAWLAITKENLKAATGINYQAGSAIGIIALNSMYCDAMMNVLDIRKQNASAPVNSNKTS